MRLILDGDPQKAGGLVGWAKQKASLLPSTADQMYRISDGSIIRVQKLKGNTVIYIHAAGLGYQFAIPFEFRAPPSDYRLFQSFAQRSLGFPKAPTGPGEPYIDENGFSLPPTAYGTDAVGGTAYMNIWWGEEGTKTFVAVSGTNQRYNTGYLLDVNVRAELDILNYTTKPTIWSGGRPTQIVDPLIETYGIAGAFVLASDGSKKLMFVVWDTDNPGGERVTIALQQPDGSFNYSELGMPTWFDPTVGSFKPPGFFCINRQGTKMVATLSTYRGELDAGSIMGKRVITGIAEWDLDVLVNPDTGEATPNFSIAFSERDEDGYIRYAAADYRWEGDGTDQLVVVKLRPYLSDWLGSRVNGSVDPMLEYQFEHRMLAVYADWHEFSGGVESPAYRSIQVMDAPLLIRIFLDPDDTNVKVYDDVAPYGYLYREASSSYFFDEGLDISDDDIENHHLNKSGYHWKIGTISAMDLRADGYVITHGARMTASVVTVQNILVHPREFEFSCFGDAGYEVITDIQLGGEIQPIGVAPPAYSGGALYDVLSSSHPEHSNSHVRVPEDDDVIASVYAAHNCILNPASVLDSDEILRTDFISIHPGKHWSAYTQFPERWMYLGSQNLRNGFIGLERNHRLFDTIRVRQATGDYLESGHLQVLSQLWGSPDLIDGEVETPMDQWLAAAAAGVWAV